MIDYVSQYVSQHSIPIGVSIMFCLRITRALVSPWTLPDPDIYHLDLFLAQILQRTCGAREQKDRTPTSSLAHTHTL